jgi:hypothetical protein
MTVYKRLPVGLAVGPSFIELLMQPHTPEVKTTIPPAAPSAFKKARLLGRPDDMPSLIKGN